MFIDKSEKYVQASIVNGLDHTNEPSQMQFLQGTEQLVSDTSNPTGLNAGNPHDAVSIPR